MKIIVEEGCFGPSIKVDGKLLRGSSEYEEFIDNHLEQLKPHIYRAYKENYEDCPEECLLWVFSDYAEWRTDWWCAEWNGFKIGTDYGFPDLLSFKATRGLFQQLLVEQWLEQARASLAWALEDILPVVEESSSGDSCPTCGSHEYKYVYEV